MMVWDDTVDQPEFPDNVDKMAACGVLFSLGWGCHVLREYLLSLPKQYLKEGFGSKVNELTFSQKDDLDYR